MNRMFFTSLGECESSELSQTELQVSQTADQTELQVSQTAATITSQSKLINMFKFWSTNTYFIYQYMYVGVVREFLSETVHSFLGRCDFKRVGASLRAYNVISVGEFQRLQACPQLEDANRFLYSLLDGDPSTRKLGALSAALKDDTTHDGHQELAQLIDQFLQGEDIGVGVVIYISNCNLCPEPHLLTTSILVLRILY